MRRLMLVALPSAMLLASTTAGATAQGPYPETQEQLEAEYGKLTWVEEPGTYDLTSSNSTVALSQGRSLLLGYDAERVLFLMNAVEFPNTEGVLYDDESGVMVTFEFFREGFVKDEDWTDVDGDRLLADIREGTEEANKERVKYGITPMTVTGWVEAPRYDAAANTVKWAIEFAEGDSQTVNATALKLSRYGYEQLTWVGTRDQYDQLGGILTTALNDHAFNEGHRYADFQDGDEVAAYGLAALVATAAGAKFGKGIIAVLVAVALAFLKKGWIFILVGLGAVFAGLKRFWARKKAEPQPEQSGAE